MFSLSFVRWRLLAAFALWIVPAVAFADTATLAWDPSEGATGYTVRWGTSQGSYPNSADAGNNTTFTISGLTAGATYWVVAQAYNSDGVSPYSVPLQFTVPGSVPVPCTYSIGPASASAPATGTTGTIAVTTQAGCAWSASSGSGALTFQNATGRTGPGSAAFTVAVNTSTTARTLTATVAGQTFTVSQAAASCTYSINPTAINVFDPAASGTIVVTTQAGCAWAATSASSFLTFQNGTGRTGSGSLTFAVTANTGTIARTGTGTVAGQPFSVSQAAPTQACTYAISPGSATAPAAGLSGTITVTTQPACAWSATTTSTFITFLNGTGRSGSGTVSYVVTANSSGFRSAAATVAGKPFSLSQLGTTCTYAVSPANISRTAAAATGTVTVSTSAGCGWSATSMTGFLTFQNGTGRTGSGSVGFTITENTDASERNAVGTVAGVTFTVAQAGTSSTPPGPLRWSSDFDGDGKNDILVQDSVVGTVEAWFLDNAILKGKRVLSESLDTTWTLAGRGDFNADHKPDLVWQNKADGRVTLWYMDGTTRIGMVDLSVDQVDPQWKIVGVGDFNADQRADLIWQHDGTGALAAWLMNGSHVFGTASLAPAQATDVRWKVVGVADFNMDSKSDLLWRHLGTGEVAAWLMNGLSVTIHAPLSPSVVADQRWQVGAVTDANGDGKPDIVWHHTDGTIMVWHMNGTSRGTFPILPVGLPVGWFVVGPK